MVVRLALALLLLLAPSVAASGLARDAAGDVVRVDDLGATPSPRADVDLRSVAIMRGEEEGRVTLGFGGMLPVELELTVVIQLAAQPERVAVVHVWRSPSDPWPDAMLSHPAAEGGVSVVTVRAAFAEDAVQLVLPSSTFAAEPCFALRSVRASHLAEDGARYHDALDVDPACTMPSATGQEAVRRDVAESAAADGSPAAGEARVPAGGAFAALGALGFAAFSRRR